MANLRTQFSELRQNTPKHVQWLLLAAAFIVVLILLTLLLRGGKKDVVTPPDAPQAAISINPDSVDWTDARVGETKSQRFVVSASAPVKVDAVRLSKEIPGLSTPKTSCTTVGIISETLSCHITVEYSPTAAADTLGASIFIDWRGASQPENMKRTETITIVTAAGDAKPEPKPEPVEPVVESKPIIQQEIEAIAPSDPFADAALPEPEPEPEPILAPMAQPAVAISAEACSDFAFPGYGLSGQQIGWIRPKGGTYMFHPFSDKNCSNPIGVYNPDNGIITDIENPGRKLGTDADHIGHTSITNGTIPQLSNPVAPKTVNKARQLSSEEISSITYSGSGRLSELNPGFIRKSEKVMTSSGAMVVSSAPYDRSFVLRQYKPIPATIVSEIRADKSLSSGQGLPVIATVDRNVYSDNGRTIIIPTGTQLMGYVTGDVPGPYRAIGRMQIKWYQFIRPDGVEFNFGEAEPFSGDAQGRHGVPGRGSTDYLEQFVMPMLTAIVPAAVNMIAPISDRFVNQIDLDNNTVTQSGQVRSSELAKNEIIKAWNNVAQKLLVDMMDNTVPPFSIAAGTRINVFSPVDLLVTCGPDAPGAKKCAIAEYGKNPRNDQMHKDVSIGTGEYAGSLVGQVRSFNLEGYCETNSDGSRTVRKGVESKIQEAGLDYRTVLFYCQSSQYQAINNAKQQAVYQNQQQTTYTNQSTGTKAQVGSEEYNKDVLGLNYNQDGTIQNPFQKLPTETPPAALTCEDGSAPDANGCCTGEVYTDMGEAGFNCCPSSGGDCFPPINQ
jgi:type IV secretory pathway VirB10-like protein